MKALLTLSVASTLLIFTSSCGEKPKAEEPVVEAQNVKTEKKYQTKCTFHQKTEVSVEGGVKKYELIRQTDFSSTVTKNSSAPGKMDKLAQGETDQKLIITLPNGEVKQNQVQFTFIRDSSIEWRDLGKGLQEDKSSIKTNRQAKKGFNFGLDADKKPILTKNDSHKYESISFYNGDKVQEYSAKMDGKIVSPAPGVFEITSKKDGKVRKTVYRLMEPTVDPFNETEKYLLSEETCEIRDLTPDPSPASTSNENTEKAADEKSHEESQQQEEQQQNQQELDPRA